jgi:signal transduction histidine kinase
MRLRTKYALVLLAILLVLGTVVAGSAELFKQQTVDQEQAELDETTRLAVEQMGESLSDEVDVIRQTALTLDTEPGSLRTEQLEQLLDNHPFNTALVVDTNGTIVELHGLQENQDAVQAGDSVTSVGFFEKTTLESLRRGNTRIERIQAVENFDDYALTIGAPMLSADGQDVQGVLVGSMFLGSTRLFSPLTPLETTRQTARVTGTTFDGEAATILPFSNSFDEVLTSEATIEETGWTVTVRRDESVLTSQLQFLQYIQFGSLLAVFLTVLGLGFYQYRTTVRQTDRLLGGFEKLTEGNFDHSLELGAAREWEQIGEGFNTMAAGLQRREREIFERERRLTVLNRLLRHNLQNDMTVIQGLVDTMPDIEDEQQRQETADKILETAGGLVDHAKKARRLESVVENAEEGTARVDIGAKVREVLDAQREDHPEVQVSFDGTESGWVEAVEGIEFGVEQLVENAFVHNTSTDPCVAVTVERENDDVVVTVRDNGPGIPEHERRVLFQDEETALEHGSGIGLWLAYWAVLKSEGDLEFGDQEEGGHVSVRLNGCEPPESQEKARTPDDG